MNGHGLSLGIGLVLLATGLFVITRSGGSEQAVYGRRIVGMMMIGGGLALTVSSIAMRFWS